VRLLFWGIVALILIVVAAYKGSFSSANRTTNGIDGVDVADADVPGDGDASDVVDTADDASAGRPVYRYSVIPGGAYDPRELAAAIDRDPVVAAEYRAVAAKGVHAEVVPADRMAYMSYRIADKIYWTKHQIKLRQGETILTDGKTQLRGRCGNGISLDPMQPTAEAEPGPLELEALSEAPLLASQRLPFDLVLPGGLSSGFGLSPGLSAGALSGTLGGPLFTGGGLSGGSPTGSSDTPPNTPAGGGPPIDVPPIVLPPGTPPGQEPIIHQIIDIAVGGDTLTNDEPPPGDGPKFPTEPNPPTDPLPTPEPTTMLLVGGGLAMALRRRRS
jgi:hypothetical protein